MTTQELEARLRRAGEGIPTGDCANLSSVPVQPMEVHDHITLPSVPSRRPGRALLLMLALVLLLCAGGGGYWYWDRQMGYSTLTLEVNPVFLLRLNRHDTVLTVDAGNADAEPLLEGRSYRGWSYEAALDTLLDDLEGGGYLGSPSDVTFTVESRSADRARVLELDAAAVLCRELDCAEDSTTAPEEPELTSPPVPSTAEPSDTPTLPPQPTLTPQPTVASGHHGKGYGGGMGYGRNNHE